MSPLRDAPMGALVFLTLLLGCGEASTPPIPEGATGLDYYARSLVAFEPGPGAGFGGDLLPDIALGFPGEASVTSASLDVVSLGAGGHVVLGFEPFWIVDGPGADLVVFENAFWADGDSARPWAEIAEVAVSADGVTWREFECADAGADAGAWPDCAGWRPTKSFEPEQAWPPDVETTGGDPFDLADVGLDRVRFVRITDLWGEGAEPSAGFDLDTVAAIHLAR